MVDETALAAMKAERERQELAARMAQPHMVRITKAIADAIPRFAKAIERIKVRHAAVAVPQT